MDKKLQQFALKIGEAFTKGYSVGMAMDEQIWRTTKKGKHYLLDTDTHSVVRGNIGTRNVTKNYRKPIQKAKQFANIKPSVSRTVPRISQASVLGNNPRQFDHKHHADQVIKFLKGKKPTGSSVPFKEMVAFEDLAEKSWEDYENTAKSHGKTAHYATSGIASYQDRKVNGYDKAVQDIYDKKVATEKQRTADLISIFDKMGGIEFSGLPNSIKSGSSTARKIGKKIADTWEKKQIRLDPTEVMQGLKDIVRYTAIVPHDEMVEKAKLIIDGLKKLGYKVSVTRNSYVAQNPDYKGLHIGFEKDGESTELQIHSPDSVHTKHLNHPWYNIARDKVNQTETAINEATQKMIANSAMLRSPKGIESLHEGEY